MRIIEGKLERELKSIIIAESPNEAAGLILADGTVIVLPNHSKSPSNSFEIHRNDIYHAIEFESDDQIVDMTLWHSHPSGGIGPSTIDMQQRTGLAHHLVISLVEGELVYTWY